MKGLTVRPARPDERRTVEAIFDGAMLSFDRMDIPARIEREAVLVAVTPDRVHGVVLVAGGHVEAVAVRHGSRGRGVGRALMRAVQDRAGVVSASCRPTVTPFYAALGFDLYTLPDGRIFGVRDA